MASLTLETEHLLLELESLEEVRQRMGELPAEFQQKISHDWPERLDEVTDDDRWVLGFKISRRFSGEAIGQCAFKGPSSPDGMVEISDCVYEDQQGKGFATEAARTLVQCALYSGEIPTVVAHTLPVKNASTRVLTKCGFSLVGKRFDPDDGPVWRWEIRQSAF